MINELLSFLKSLFFLTFRREGKLWIWIVWRSKSGFSFRNKLAIFSFCYSMKAYHKSSQKMKIIYNQRYLFSAWLCFRILVSLIMTWYVYMWVIFHAITRLVQKMPVICDFSRKKHGVSIFESNTNYEKKWKVFCI